MIRRTHPPVHCAPLERQTLVALDVYKHLAPLEQEHRLVAALLRWASVVSFLWRAFTTETLTTKRTHRENKTLSQTSG
jgi:hypothetical protein